MPPIGATSSSAGFRGEIMLRALLADISLMGTLKVSILRDPELGCLDLPSCTFVVPWLPHHDALSLVDECIQQADAIWPLAPESNGVLEAISSRALQYNKLLLGSSPAAVRLTASKYRTSQVLHAAGVAAVATYRVNATLPSDAQAWVVKPDDGAGCSDTRIFSHPKAARQWIAAQHQGDYVLQPYLSGRPCSLSLLCGTDEVLMLGCNDQRVAVSDNQFHSMGSTVNSIDDDSGELQRLARQVVSAIPGIWGFAGINLILTNQGPVVLEVNPRMTLSHAGLHASIGVNPVEILMDMLRQGHCGVTKNHQRSRQVSIDVNAWQHRTPAPGSIAR